jgi:tRNA(Ile)-lysidine synthase
MIDEITGRDTVPIINRTAGMIASDEDFIKIECEKAFKGCVKTDDSSAVINNAAFNMLHEAIASRILRKAYASVEGTLKDFEKKNTDALMDMIRKGKTGDSIDLSSGTYAIVQFGNTIIRSREKTEDYEYILEVPGSIYIRERDITINSTFDQQFNGSCEKGFICIESENAGPLTVRNRRDGDRFTPAKGNGTKKLKKYFIDQKIDRMERNKVFLLIFSGKIAYIEGMEHGKGFVPSEGCAFVRIGIERGKKDV